ncbi:hypothetical protein [Sanguibacter sp. 25GB23B1]|uniref:hypothetical protein n=1 Tax=unclassified Sanguibacter TaxID=2645534 RepID=UPI0032AF7B1D
MQDVTSGTDLLALVPLYIAVEPRDPRGEGARTEDAIEHVPAATVEEVASVLTQLGVPAEMLDGAHLGAPGWVIARTVGWSDGRIVRWAPDENPASGPYPTLSCDDVATYLSRAIDVACRVGEDLEIPAEGGGDHGLGIVIEQRSGAVVGRLRSTEAPHLAHLMESALWFAQIDGTSIVAAVDPAADLEPVATYASATPTVGLERNGPWRRIGLMRGRAVLAAHEWGPRWKRLDPSEGVAPYDGVMTLVYEYFDTPVGDVAEFARELDLTDVQTRKLQALFDDADVDDPFTAVMRLFGLPVEAAEVAEGWLDPADLPDVRRVESQPFVRAMWSSLTTVPTEPGRINDLQRLWIYRPRAYWLLSIAEAVVAGGAAVGLLRSGARRGSGPRTALGWASAVTAVVTVADMALPRRWRGLEPR